MEDRQWLIGETAVATDRRDPDTGPCGYAGNYGTNPITGKAGYGGTSSPGNAPSAITVGAVRTRGTATRAGDDVAPFSARGPTWHDGWNKPDVVAPGDGLVASVSPFSALYRNRKLHADTARYLKLSGTSMATAVTTGVIALMIEAHRWDGGPHQRRFSRLE